MPGILAVFGRFDPFSWSKFPEAARLLGLFALTQAAVTHLSILFIQFFGWTFQDGFDRAPRPLIRSGKTRAAEAEVKPRSSCAGENRNQPPIFRCGLAAGRVL